MEGFSAAAATRTYCRPRCRPDARAARTFPTAAAAEAAGYRPCPRCRPYRWPEPLPVGVPEPVCRGVRFIRTGGALGAALTSGLREQRSHGDSGAHAAADAGTDDETDRWIAAQLDIGTDELRRAFLAHLGATPTQVAQSHRAHTARRLLDDTALPLADIARACGLDDTRQLAALCLEVFGALPDALRARRFASDRIDADRGLVLRLPFRPPYDWAAALAALRARAIPGVERVAGATYRRTIVAGGETGTIEIASRGADHLALRVEFPRPDGLIRIVERARRTLKLDLDPAAETRGHAPGAGGRAGRRHVPRGGRDGVGPATPAPGAWDPCEAAVRLVVGRQATAAGASTIIRRLVECHGTPLSVAGPPGLTHAFPSPEVLAQADLCLLGLTRPRADAISIFAGRIAEGRIRFDASMRTDALVSTIADVPGLDVEVAHAIAWLAGEPTTPPANPEIARLLVAGVAAPQPAVETRVAVRPVAWQPARPRPTVRRIVVQAVRWITEADRPADDHRPTPGPPSDRTPTPA